MDIKGIDKPTILAALYNRAQPQGMGFLQYDPTPWSTADAQTYISRYGLDYDYILGRVMKINISEDEVDTRGYNRDNGENAAETVLVSLKNTGSINALAHRHRGAVQEQANEIRPFVGQPTTKKTYPSGFTSISLGIEGDLAKELKKRLDRVPS